MHVALKTCQNAIRLMDQQKYDLSLASWNAGLHTVYTVGAKDNVPQTARVVLRSGVVHVLFCMS